MDQEWGRSTESSIPEQLRNDWYAQYASIVSALVVAFMALKVGSNGLLQREREVFGKAMNSLQYKPVQMTKHRISTGVEEQSSLTIHSQIVTLGVLGMIFNGLTYFFNERWKTVAPISLGEVLGIASEVLKEQSNQNNEEDDDKSSPPKSELNIEDRKKIINVAKELLNVHQINGTFSLFELITLVAFYHDIGKLRVSPFINLILSEGRVPRESKLEHVLWDRILFDIANVIPTDYISLLKHLDVFLNTIIFHHYSHEDNNTYPTIEDLKNFSDQINNLGQPMEFPITVRGEELETLRFPNDFTGSSTCTMRQITEIQQTLLSTIQSSDEALWWDFFSRYLIRTSIGEGNSKVIFIIPDEFEEDSKVKLIQLIRICDIIAAVFFALRPYQETSSDEEKIKKILQITGLGPNDINQIIVDTQIMTRCFECYMQ